MCLEIESESTSVDFCSKQETCKRTIWRTEIWQYQSWGCPFWFGPKAGILINGISYNIRSFFPSNFTFVLYNEVKEDWWGPVFYSLWELLVAVILVTLPSNFSLVYTILFIWTQRENAVDDFRAGNTWVLIATDVVARGLDFKGVNCVINFDFPDSAAAYIHRIGIFLNLKLLFTLVIMDVQGSYFSLPVYSRCSVVKWVYLNCLDQYLAARFLCSEFHFPLAIW